MTTQVVPVGLLTSYIRELFDADGLLADVWVEGEISNLFRAQSGHVYFSLKDCDSQLKCALFRGHALRQRYQPRAGDQVAAHGHVSVYERDGAYQLYVDVVQPAGLGLLALQLERLRQQLDAEGLFDPARKRPIPPRPRVIGVVTSPDGAVWHDIQNVVRRRYPFVELVLAPAAVQGERAPAQLVAALESLQLDGRCDVIILARGGGSAEDLAAFNDERVARAVFACRVPVISAVGHETDWTIVDDVADLRAPTPSAAAELVVPEVADLAERLVDLELRLAQSSRERVAARRAELLHLSRHMARLDPQRLLAARRGRLADLTHRATARAHRNLLDARERVDARADVLAALAPHAVLGRGYAVLMDEESGSPICRLADAAAERRVRAWLADGSLVARVEALAPAAPRRTP